MSGPIKIYGNESIKVYEPGEKMDIDWRRQDINFICCDCGLWHRLRFAVAGNKLRMRAWLVAEADITG